MSDEEKVNRVRGMDDKQKAAHIINRVTRDLARATEPYGCMHHNWELVFDLREALKLLGHDWLTMPVIEAREMDADKYRRRPA